MKQPAAAQQAEPQELAVLCACLRPQANANCGKLAAVFETQLTWVNICTPEGVIVDLNSAALEIMEAGSRHDLIGKRLRDFVTAEYRHLFRGGVLEGVLQTGKARAFIVEVTTCKGNRRCLEIHSTLMHHSPDAPLIVSMISDQTARIHEQALAQQHREELTRVMRLNLLGELASWLAHELNQPLAAAANYIQGCRRRLEQGACNPHELEEALKQVAEQVCRARGTLRHTRHFIRQEHKGGISPASLNPTVQQALDLLQAAAQFRQARLELELGAGLPLVGINPPQIVQVLANLIKNALDAAAMQASSHPPTVHIRTHRQDADTVQVQVSDNGAGIAPADLDKLFNPFFTTKPGGLGMGLALSRSIIEAHGGKLSASNNPAGGAVFSFTLPVGASRKATAFPMPRT